MGVRSSDDPDAARRYFSALRLPPPGASDAHREALARAHALRKFEIENYWKRSAYFWGFQLVAFGALALSAKDGRFHPPIVVLIAVVGALAAWTAVLSAKGSKFWQRNWETHVDYLETAVEGTLHEMAFIDDRPSFSVSRVNEAFLQLLFVGWILAFLSGAAVIAVPSLALLPGGLPA